MRILLIGSGGREHALAWKLAQSPKCDVLYCAPGNAGIEEVAECVPVKAEDVQGLLKFAQERAIDFTIVGPEAPLVAGVVDAFEGAGLKIFGPSKAASILEGSKGFMKDLCAKYDIPTARYGRFTDFEEAKSFIEELHADKGAPIVIKTDGLAAGKGVIIAQSLEEALDAASGMLSGESFGAAGQEVVVEEFLDGEEVSYFALTDGTYILPLTSAQDHKRAFDNDEGPNTGGMGAYSPARPEVFTKALEREVVETILEPTVKGMAAEGVPYKGVLYAGLMIVNGKPYLIEYNIRFGDPECQPIMMRLESDLLDLLLALEDGAFANVPVQWSDQQTLCVVMAANGYPGAYEKGSVIKGLNEAQSEKVKIFHAGTARSDGGEVTANGGRVLNVVARDDGVIEAQKAAYAAIQKIDWPEGFYRKDIGNRWGNRQGNR